MELARLVWRNLWRRKLRTLLTVGSLVVALFLLCVLRTLVTTLASGAEAASSRRLIVQSAVSLFVDLPLAYEARIASVPGVEDVLKWQWFGGYYLEKSNFFAQFAVDAESVFDVYPEMQIVAGSVEDFLADRRACVVGEGLIEQYGWKLGDTIPILPTLFPRPDDPEAAWEFRIAAVYRPTQRNVDPRTMLFHWKYFQETLAATPGGGERVGTFVIRLADGADPTQVMATVDAMFENGPQRVQTTPESEFQQQFVTMLGNVPFFVATIGGGVLAAILLAVVNTMLMAGREQTHDLGILKALGFRDGHARSLLVAQSLLLCVVGGGLGLLLALATEPGIAGAMGVFFPGYHVEPGTYALGAAVVIGLGVVAGAAPAWRAGRLRPVEALGAED